MIWQDSVNQYRGSRSEARPRRGLAATLVGGLITCWVAIPEAGADEIMVGDRKIPRVQIVGYVSSDLEYRMPGGDYNRVPLRDVTFLFLDSITGVRDFNEAEEYLRDGQPLQAVGRYERSLRPARGFWSDIARVRLLVAADRAAQFEKAVRAFLDVAERDPVTAAHLMPLSVPSDGSAAGRRTMRRIRRALEDAPSDQTRLLLELLRYETLRVLSDPEAVGHAPQVAASSVPGPLMTARVAAIQAAALETLMSAGRTEEVARAVDDMIRSAPLDELPPLLLTKARALLAGAATEDQFLRAALPAMRVAIHYADSVHAGDGLLIAAAAHRSSGHAADSERLYRRCLTIPSATEKQKEQARDALARLSRPGVPGP